MVHPYIPNSVPQTKTTKLAVVDAADVEEFTPTEATDSITAVGGQATAVRCDVSRAADCERLEAYGVWKCCSITSAVSGGPPSVRSTRRTGRWAWRERQIGHVEVPAGDPAHGGGPGTAASSTRGSGGGCGRRAGGLVLRVEWCGGLPDPGHGHRTRAAPHPVKCVCPVTRHRDAGRGSPPAQRAYRGLVRPAGWPAAWTGRRRARNRPGGGVRGQRRGELRERYGAHRRPRWDRMNVGKGTGHGH